MDDTKDYEVLVEFAIGDTTHAVGATVALTDAAAAEHLEAGNIKLKEAAE